MRYRCSNKNCPYYKRQKKYWRWEGKVDKAPLKCPDCGKELRRYKLSATIGDEFETEIRDLTNSYLDLGDIDSIQKVPGSGKFHNNKGDLRHFPKPINNLLVSVKKEEVGKKFIKWWRKARKDAITMGSEPCIIMAIEDTIVVGFDYKWFLKLIKKIRGEIK